MLKGKIGIVTGGGSGIGKSIVQVLLKHECNVAILDKNVSAGEATVGSFSSMLKSSQRVVFYECDVTVDLAAVFSRVENEMGPFHIVCNNAGVSLRHYQFPFSASKDAWTKVLAVNLVAVIEGTQLAAQAFRRNSIVDG